MTKYLKATDEEVKEYVKSNWCYDKVNDKVCWIKDGEDVKFSVCKKGYLYKTITVKLYTTRNIWCHQVVYYLYTGEFNTKLRINHKDGNVSNNNISNLELITNQQNVSYKTKLSTRNTSGAHGVCWYKAYKKWRAKIVINRKTKHIGYFDSIEEAIVARDKHIIDHNLTFYPTSQKITLINHKDKNE